MDRFFKNQIQVFLGGLESSNWILQQINFSYFWAFLDNFKVSILMAWQLAGSIIQKSRKVLELAILFIFSVLWLL